MYPALKTNLLSPDGQRSGHHEAAMTKASDIAIAISEGRFAQAQALRAQRRVRTFIVTYIAGTEKASETVQARTVAEAVKLTRYRLGFQITILGTREA